jgi:hypothetical protein
MYEYITTELQNKAFNIFIILSYISYIAYALGISNDAKLYIERLDYYVKIYISLFLLWRFNMFRKITFTELDRKIAFSAGLFLFTTTAINEILMKYLTNIKDKFHQSFLKENTQMF